MCTPPGLRATIGDSPTPTEAAEAFCWPTFWMPLVDTTSVVPLRALEAEDLRLAEVLGAAPLILRGEGDQQERERRRASSARKGLIDGYKQQGGA